MTLVISSHLDCRSQSSTMLDEPHTPLQQRTRFISMDERNSVGSSSMSMSRDTGSTSIASRTVEDSMQGWADDDDEYSCNSSSDVSDPQLLDDNSSIVRQPATTTNYRNDPMIIADDDNDTQSTNTHHRSCYESVHCELQRQRCRPKKVQFYWLPNSTSKVSQMSSNAPYHNFIYVGLTDNPPVVCVEGTTRGNMRSLHRKAWLEVSDTKHRYGKHLRMYYRHWESLYILTLDTNNNSTLSEAVLRGTFFDWLDSKGIHNGKALPEIPDCPRSVLDSDTVAYIDDARESQQYAVRVVTTPYGVGRLILSNGNGSTVRTGSTGWMFVIRDNVMYVAPKVINNVGIMCTKRFHHSSFFGGRAVQAAGIIITDETNGSIQQVLPHSGHYRPGEYDVQRVLYFLHEMGVCWTTFSVDVQQFLFIDRSCSSSSCPLKKKKVESLHLRSAVSVVDFLSHKARCLQPHGIFAEIEARRFAI